MKKTNRSGLVAASLLSAAISLPAQAAFVIEGGSLQGLPIAGNDFNSQITALGFNQVASGAQLRVSQNGYIDFHYVGAESGYNNSFTARGGDASPVTLNENNEAFNFAGYNGFSIAVSANDIVDFSFTSDSIKALTPVDNRNGINLQGLGILYDSSQGGPLMQVLLGYDDQVKNDDNDLDDMLIRADFRPALPGSDLVTAVPLPAAAGLFAAGLAGLAGFSRRSAARS